MANTARALQRQWLRAGGEQSLCSWLVRSDYQRRWVMSGQGGMTTDSLWNLILERRNFRWGQLNLQRERIERERVKEPGPIAGLWAKPSRAYGPEGSDLVRILIWASWAALMGLVGGLGWCKWVWVLALMAELDSLHLFIYLFLFSFIFIIIVLFLWRRMLGLSAKIPMSTGRHHIKWSFFFEEKKEDLQNNQMIITV